MDQIRESMDRLSDLDNDQIEELSNQIIQEFESAESKEVTAEVVEVMHELGANLEKIRAELDNRTAQAQELTTLRDEAIKRVRGEDEDSENPEDEVEEDEEEDDSKKVVVASAENADEKTELSNEEPVETPDVDTENAEPAVVESTEPDTEVEPDGDTEEEETSVDEEPAEEVVSDEAVTPESEGSPELSTESIIPEVKTELAADEDAAASSDEAEGAETELSLEGEAKMSNEVEPLQAPEDRRPAAEVSEVETAKVTITAGGDIPGVGNGSVLSSMDAVANAFTQRLHAVRRTSGGDGEQFEVAKISVEYPESRVLSTDAAANERKISSVTSPEAITAAGGFCAPVETSYDIFGFGTTNRPVKDSLAQFSADRGGIRFTTPPVLGDLDGAVSVWTLDDDIEAASGGAGPTKPCLRVDCGQEVVVHTDAIPLCLTFGNLQTRAFPEQVKRNNELAIVSQARFAETRLMTRIGSLSTTVTAGSTVGASRDFFVQVDKAAAAYRSRHRLAPDNALRVILPSWFKNLIRADITLSMPAGDDTDRFGIADNIVDSWFRARHINVTWALDGESGQVFGAQGANAGLLDFPSNLVWYLFSEGTFLFLDGGTLDLGIVRDSTLNSTNDYKMFVESFEAVAKVGIESLRVVSTLQVNGASAGTVDPATI